MKHKNIRSPLTELSINSLKNAPRLRATKAQATKAISSAKENAKFYKNTVRRNSLLKPHALSNTAKPQKTLERKRSKIGLKANNSFNTERKRQSNENIRKSYNSMNRYTSLESLSKYNQVNPVERTLSTSKTLCHLLSFNLPTILDTSLDEESVSPVEDNKVNDLTEAIKKVKKNRMLIDISHEFRTTRQNYADKRKNKLSVDLRAYETTARINKPKHSYSKSQAKIDNNSKVINEENERRHIVRSYLNKLYTKIVLNLRTTKKEKRHSNITPRFKNK